jgi:signal transduction histidine kinase
VTIDVGRELLTIDVVDDGVGFDAAAPSDPRKDGSGFGLVGLRERVEGASGTLSIESAPRKGTSVAIHVPLSATLRSDDELADHRPRRR